MTFEIPRQGETATYTGILKDENDVAIPSASMASITLTFKDEKTGTVINSRTAQNVLNTNQHTLHATDGTLTWSMQAADNPLVDTGLPEGDTERHIAEYTFVAGGKTGKHIVNINVRKGLV